MQITVIAVGSAKDPFYKQAAQEYIKRLTPYTSVRVIELNEEPRPQKASQKSIQQAMEAEAERILQALPKESTVVPLCVEGKMEGSVSFAQSLARWAEDGGAQITFIIGGSDGLSPRIKALGPKLSFSPMTFPHTLMRVILLEQIYRAFRILRNEPYHK